MNRKCSKLRLYPTKAQAKQLAESLEACRQVYNSLVNDRKYQYEVNGVSVGRFDQQAYLPAWKKTHPELGKVYSQVLQDVVHRVELAFQAFFDRVKKGGPQICDRCGNPMFRTVVRWYKLMPADFEPTKEERSQLDTVWRPEEPTA